MMRRAFVLAVIFVAGGVLAPLSAQKVPPTSTQRPAAQPAAAPASGKQPPGQTAPRQALPAPAPAPAPATPQPAAPVPTAPQPQVAQPSATPSTTTPAAPAPAVTPQASHPQPANTGAYTTGLAMPPFAGGTTEEAWEYAARLGRMLDSAIVTLVATFQNASGQPVIGATGPTMLSHREQDRWTHCRDLYWDLTTYAEAVSSLRAALGTDAALQRAAADLDSAFSRSVATAECDYVASMIAAPARFLTPPWQDQYESAARHFYRDFYSQILDVHDKDRALMVELNRVLPAAHRVPPPPGLPRNPPYAGAAPN